MRLLVDTVNRLSVTADRTLIFGYRHIQSVNVITLHTAVQKLQCGNDNQTLNIILTLTLTLTLLLNSTQ